MCDMLSLSRPTPKLGARRHWGRTVIVGGALVGGATLAIACSERAVGPAAGSRLPLGTWGGANAAFIATDTVTHVHVGCTFGDIAANVALDKDGRFTMSGSYVLRAYPIYIGPRLPARFSGQVVGKTLTFSVAVNDTVNKTTVSLGPVSVVLDKQPNMGPCPVCATPKRVP